MPLPTELLLAAAGQATFAAGDMIEAVRDGGIDAVGNIASGDTATILADSLRLLLEAMDAPEDRDPQLYGALIRFLEDRT